MKIVILIVVALLLGGGGYYFFVMKGGLSNDPVDGGSEALIIQPGDLVEEVETEFAILSGGSFWDLETKLLSVDGVLSTRLGYIGGDISSPAYDLVQTGTTGHAESVEVMYNRNKIKYREIVEYFIKEAHDPTKVVASSSGNGSQKRSAIFYSDETQKEMAEVIIRDVKRRKFYALPIVTRIEPATDFYEAEPEHQRGFEGEEGESRIIQFMLNVKK